jgi:hypothetical protein
MTSALLVKRSVRLAVSGVEVRLNLVVRKLTQLSGLNVERGGLLGRKLYAYFDDVDSASAAASAMVGITCCGTKVSIGHFDVTHLVLSDRMQKIRNLKRQAQTTKTVKRANVDLGTTRSTRTLLRAKNAKI